MFAPPKSLVNFGTSLLTARTARKLQQPGRTLGAQERIFSGLIKRFAQTAFGREIGLEPGLAYEAFRKRAAPRTYEDFHPYVERMKKGEAGVLWPGRCAFYAVSSGTTAGRTKYLPVTEDMLRHFRQAGLDSLLYYTARVGHTGIFAGRQLFLGGSTTLARLEESKPFVAYAGDLSGITALNLPAWVEKHLYEPGPAIAQMNDWPEKIKAIAARCRPADITLLAGIPSWILILAEALHEQNADAKSPITNLQSLWPNLECFVHGGVPIAPFHEELRRALGPDVNFHEVYPASEGFIAAQDAESSAGLRLMAEAGLFFEFLPLADFDERNLASLGPKVVPLVGVQAGVDYALLLTTPAGLCRYVIGDVVRFISTEPPRLIYVGRTTLQLSAFGEHIIEKELTDALTAVCTRHGWHTVNFHVAPYFMDSTAGRRRGRHEWWIELKTPSVETPTGPVIAVELDLELGRRNADYEAKRKGGNLEAPLVRLVTPGVFEQWMKQAGKWGGQNKMPRCRSDRQVASQLLELTRFYSESKNPFSRPVRET